MTAGDAMAGPPLHIMLIAAEPSGDALGAELARGLRRARPEARLSGVGGPAMAQAGLPSLFPIDRLAVMGLADVLPAIPEVFRRARQVAEFAAQEKPDAVVLIDSWGFSHQAARAIRRTGAPVQIVKYAAPQVWASRPHRAKVLAGYADYVLTLLPFEPEAFRAVGLKADYAGNPNFQRAAVKGDGARFRAVHAIAADDPVLLAAPGSRRNEVRALMGVFGETVAALARAAPALRVAVPAAPGVAEEVRAAARDWPAPVVFVEDGDAKRDAFAAANAALAASGTVTTEIALAGAPLVVAYKVDPLTAVWVRRVITTRYVTILNVIADAEIIPEFLQDRCRPDQLAPAVLDLLTNPAARDRQRRSAANAIRALKLDDEPAGVTAARLLLDHIEKQA